MMTVPLHGKKAAGRVALVDDGDYEAVMRHRWSLQESNGNVYAITNVPRDGGGYRTVLMHKLLTGWSRTDHRNHNGLDNQRHNLRPATAAQNNANRLSERGTSRYKGVSLGTSGRWVANMRVNTRRIYLGTFDSEVDAARAYDTAALAAWGEYAWLNLPGLPPLAPPEPRVCPVCGVLIVASRTARARYCSDQCRSVARHRRDRAQAA